MKALQMAPTSGALMGPGWVLWSAWRLGLQRELVSGFVSVWSLVKKTAFQMACQMAQTMEAVLAPRSEFVKACALELMKGCGSEHHLESGSALLKVLWMVQL